MEANRKTWMKRQTALRKLLEGAAPQASGLEILLSQHAMLHTAKMAGSESWSYADEILGDLSELEWRSIPAGEEHSVAWMIWHTTRIEDMAMNILVAGSQQIFQRGGWDERMKVRLRSSGNEMDAGAIGALSAEIDLEALQDYRMAVGRRTREIILRLELADLKQRVEAGRIQKVLEADAIDESARYITNYWSRRTTAGLLLMPATRHNFVHLNEAAILVKKLHSQQGK